MLQVKSFLMSDDKGMNELLKTHTIAEGATIMVSEGKVVVPFQDGLPPTKEQKRIFILEKKLDHELKVQKLEHDLKVQMNKANGAVNQLNEIIEKLSNAEESAKASGNKKQSKEVYDHKKELEERKKTLTQVVTQAEISMTTTRAEITNQMGEIEVYNEELKELE